ncbi:MAG: IS110 family transposase [Vicinamibacteria bacterium]|nr:IS110 family transposase [Vicinamibacteria bacterium]
MKKNSKSGQSLKVVNPNAAGIDIGSRVHYVAVPEGRGARAVESFGCVTAELERMARWLKACGVDTVAMEATGVYWIPVCAVLEDHGFEVILVDPRQVKNAKGRKTDVQDGAWIQKLHSFGLLSASFRPDRVMQPVRDYWRMRSHLVQDAARQIHLMQKNLEQMNVQLHKVLSDISGISGMRILRAIVAGQRNPEELAAMAVGGIKATPKEVAEALRGHYREQHVFALSQALLTFDFLHERIRECDLAIEGLMKRFPSKNDEIRILPPQKRRKNQPHFDLAQELARVTGVDFSIVPGLSAMTVQTAVSECGINLGASFIDEHHYSSWLGLSPNNKITGGRVFSTRSLPRPSPAAVALRLAAQSLQSSKSALGDRYRRLRARLGAPKAITAMAHLLAKFIYRGLTRGQTYLEAGLAALENQSQNNTILALHRRAHRLGYELTPLQKTA